MDARRWVILRNSLISYLTNWNVEWLGPSLKSRSDGLLPSNKSFVLYPWCWIWMIFIRESRQHNISGLNLLSIQPACLGHCISINERWIMCREHLPRAKGSYIYVYLNQTAPNRRYQYMNRFLLFPFMYSMLKVITSDLPISLRKIYVYNLIIIIK